MPRPRLPFRLLAAAAGLICALPVARAMSVLPPASLDELVASADSVVRGVVTDIRPEEFDSPQGRGVRTLVTLRVERALKGTPGETVTLTLLGGKVGRHTLRISGMPQFNIGDREIVFVAQNGTALCPLVSAGHGRYHVRTDAATGREFITRDNGVPLASLAEISAPLEAAAASTATPARALALADFEGRIARAVAQQTLTRSLP
jgi:hypothetical protein